MKKYGSNGEFISEQYPIAFQSFIGIDSYDGRRRYKCNPYGVVFIPLFVRLLILFAPRLFTIAGPDADKNNNYETSLSVSGCGGLLLRNTMTQTNVLESLVLTTKEGYKKYAPNHYKLVDDKFYNTMEQLKEMNVMETEDICKYDLLNKLCFQSSSEYFPVKRFQFLVEWDPAALEYAVPRNGFIPLHFAANKPANKSIITINDSDNDNDNNNNNDNTPVVLLSGGITSFRTVFKAGIHYLPLKYGLNLLFRLDKDNETPFQDACSNYGIAETKKVIETTLIDHYCDVATTTTTACSTMVMESSSTNNSNNADADDGTTTEAFLLAVSDDTIHLDGVYFHLHNNPDILLALLSGSHGKTKRTTTKKPTTTTTTITAKSNDGKNNNSNGSRSGCSSSSSSTSISNSSSNDNNDGDGLMMEMIYPQIRKRKKMVCANRILNPFENIINEHSEPSSNE